MCYGGKAKCMLKIIADDKQVRFARGPCASCDKTARRPSEIIRHKCTNAVCRSTRTAACTHSEAGSAAAADRRSLASIGKSSCPCRSSASHNTIQ